jgi:hypothetical protein
MARRARQRDRRRTWIELETGEVVLHTPDGHTRVIPVGAAHTLVDAACNQRFVRLLRLEGPGGGASIITPPEEGSIAPRAARLPVAPDDAAVVEARAFDTLLDWLAAGGRLGSHTIEELARLARLASAPLAVAIGELAVQVAREMSWGGDGPMRGSGLDARRLLRPLEIAARDSERASDALVAALAQWPLTEVLV